MMRTPGCRGAVEGPWTRSPCTPLAGTPLGQHTSALGSRDVLPAGGGPGEGQPQSMFAAVQRVGFAFGVCLVGWGPGGEVTGCGKAGGDPGEMKWGHDIALCSAEGR